MKNWPKFKLGELCKMNSGGTPRRGVDGYYNGDIPWAKISDIENACKGEVLKTEENITKEGLKSIGNKIFPIGTLLLAMYGSVGKTAFAGVELSTNQAILGIKVIDTSVLNPRYLKYWIDSIKDKLVYRAVGGTLQNISLGIVKELEIPLPPLPIQQQIADTLDKADALRRKDQELLDKYDELAQAVFYEMFGDPNTNNKKWKIKPLGDLVSNKSDLVDGPFGSSINVKTDYVSDGEIPVVRTKNVGILEFFEEDLMYMNREKFEAVKRSQILPGDIIITKVGTIGNIAFFPKHLKEGVLSTTGSCRFRPNPEKINPIFLIYNLLYQRTYMKRIAAEGVQPFLNMSHIKSIPIFDTPLDLQIQFSERIKRIWESVTLLKKSLRDCEILYESLSYKYFS